MKRTILWIALGCASVSQAVHANSAAATVCAASLEQHARLVFDAVTARPQPELALREVISARTRELVFTDRLMADAARPAAEAASGCLRIARDCTGDRC